MRGSELESRVGPPSLAPLNRLTDSVGLFEHASHRQPRNDEGYCTDDNGRGLAVVSHVGGPDAARLARLFLRFLQHGHMADGSFHLRLGYDGDWTEDPPSDDANGRAIQGLGAAVACGPDEEIRRSALALFDAASAFRSPFWRSTASAALGATAVLDAMPGHDLARRMVEDAVISLPRPQPDDAWVWPEERLRYGNARLPHALIALGKTLGDDRAVNDGLLLLRWLIRRESRDDRFSFTPVDGRGPADAGPGFDQQPIEAWAMAEAALAAFGVAPEPLYAEAIARAASWFDGNNDVGISLVDPVTGGCFDGLEAAGVNQNQGAESQLALLATRHAQHQVTIGAGP